MDGQLWDMTPRFLHVENVLLHAVNTILVFFLTLQLILLYGGGGSLPFVTALLFAGHPVNSEAVAWFAGRTDPLAAIFVLSGTILILRWHRLGTRSPIEVLFALALGGSGVLAKETAGMFFFTLYCLPVNIFEVFKEKISKSVFWGMILAAVLASGFIAKQWMGGGNASFVSILNFNTDAIGLKLFMLIKSIGFYASKLVFPIPLNFATISLHWAYSLVGLAFMIWVYSAIKWGGESSFLPACMLMYLIPPLFVSISGISWVPVAERYLYIPGVFFIVYVTTVSEKFARKRNRSKVFYFIAGIVVLMSSYITYNRTMDWHDSMSILRDSVAKSPEFGDLRNDLAAKLFQNGEMEEGRYELKAALELSHNPHVDHLVRLNLLESRIKGKSAEETLVILNRELQDRSNASVDELGILRSALERYFTTTTDLVNRRKLSQEIVELSDIMLKRQPDPYLLYRSGQHLLFLGEKKRAAAYFLRAYAEAPKSAAYRDAARTLADKLGKQE